MENLRAREQGPKRDRFSVTSPVTPWLPLPDQLAPQPGLLQGEGVRPDSPPDRVLDVPLTGQEFLLFRGIRTPEDVEQFALGYGRLGIDDLALTYAYDYQPHQWPLWVRLLTHDPRRSTPQVRSIYAAIEPTEDWIRQAGLMEAAIGLLGLLESSQARQALRRILRRARKRDDLAQASEGTSSWPVRSVLGGLLRSGLELEIRSRDSGDVLAFCPPPALVSWGLDLRPEQESEEEIVLGAEGVHPLPLSMALRPLLYPWARQVTLELGFVNEGLRPVPRIPRSLLAVLWLQLLNAAFEKYRLRECAWERCKGPPDRPGIFLWRWGRRPVDIRHRDAMYCHPRCASAASSARTRQSPAYQAGRGRR